MDATRHFAGRIDKEVELTTQLADAYRTEALAESDAHAAKVRRLEVELDLADIRAGTFRSLARTLEAAS